MCWFYMGIAQIALDPPPSVKRANVEKKCPKPSWQAFLTLTLPLTGNAHVETTHFKKGLPSGCLGAAVRISFEAPNKHIFKLSRMRGWLLLSTMELLDVFFQDALDSMLNWQLSDVQ